MRFTRKQVIQVLFVGTCSVAGYFLSREKRIISDPAIGTPQIPAQRLSFNVPGRFYVTSECIDCDLCRETAPTLFKRNEEELAYVSRQPELLEELALMSEALEGCPVEAIIDGKGIR